MTPEEALADFIVTVTPGDASADALRTAYRIMLSSIGPGIAAAGEDGIEELRQLLLQRGGRAEARSYVYGDALPAYAAAQLNGTLSRALDFCDAMAPGPHFGSAVVPAALAATELVGGVSGAEFLSALIAGAEVGTRMNLTESMLDGRDPTGVIVVFGSTAAACRILGLTRSQTLNALGLAFNRSGGSFQSNVDGTLAVRVVQGWVAQTGIECAQLAQIGITGPPNFLTGVYGYRHLFGLDELDVDRVASELGTRWQMNNIVYKKYPSCGATQGLTSLILELVEDLDLKADDVEHVEVRFNPYNYLLVGQDRDFTLSSNVRVDAQFSAQYCIANAIVRGMPKLTHFTPEQVMDPEVQALMARVTAIGDPELNPRGHTATDVTVTTRSGVTKMRQLDIAPGFPGNELTDEEHLGRFQQCMEYARYPLPPEQIERFLDLAANMASVPDARALLDATISPLAAKALAGSPA